MVVRTRADAIRDPHPQGRSLSDTSPTNAVLRLQRRAGNRAVTAVLREPALEALLRQRSVVAGSPAVAALSRQPVLKDPPTQQQVTAEDLQKTVHAHVETWYLNSRLGILTADTHDDDDAQKWFLIALLGNLLWAATSLAAAEWVVLIRVMSFAGATIGSGTLQQWFDTKSASELKDMIVEELSRRASQMETNLPLKKRLAAEFARRKLTDATDDEQSQKRSELAWMLMFGDKVPYNDRWGLEKRARDTVERIAVEFSKIYKGVKTLVQSTSPGAPMPFDEKGLTSGPEYVKEHYKDLGGYIGNVANPKLYRKNWPHYVFGMYHLALIRSGVVHEMLPDVTTRDLTPSQKEYAFSDGTTVVLEQDFQEGALWGGSVGHKVQLDPLAGATIYVPTENRGPVRLGDF